MGVDDVTSNELRTAADQLRGIIATEGYVSAEGRAALRGLVNTLALWADVTEDAELAAVPPRRMSLRRLLSF
jgi:hypothetical protein